MARRALRIGAALIATSLAAGCSTAEPKQEPGMMTATYQDATTPAAIQGRTLMQNARVLEDMADYINGYLKLPYGIELVGSQCGDSNAFWSAADKRITVCYEFADFFLTVFNTDPNEHVTDPAEAAVNSIIATAYHELGHAVISIYDLPATGRLEDASDQLAAYMWLVPDDNIKNDAPQVVKDFAEMFKRYSANRRGLVNDDFADEHSLDLTRMYNLACWVYGANPAANADVVAQVGLPKLRADSCEFEFRQISKAWKALLAPYVK
ncbi:MAG: DUF4344 domain-containing metallopeptidase [Mycobacterium sp.]